MIGNLAAGLFVIFAMLVSYNAFQTALVTRKPLWATFNLIVIGVGFAVLYHLWGLPWFVERGLGVWTIYY